MACGCKWCCRGHSGGAPRLAVCWQALSGAPPFFPLVSKEERATGTPMGAPWPTSNSVKSARWSAIHPLSSPPCGMRRCGQACGLEGLVEGSGKAGEGPGTCMVYPHPPCTPTKTCHAAFPWYLFFIGTLPLSFFFTTENA